MFDWKDDFVFNIKQIDNEHMKLFEIGSQIYELTKMRKESDRYDEIMSVIEELKDYTMTHFEHEEELMLKYDYEGYHLQKIEHDFFVKKLQRIEKKDIEEAQSDALMEMLTFIADWISSHILKTDMEYVEFFKTKGL